MAGGKETPRQKMIGMMYLVLTALLALNVSKQIVAAFITLNDKIDRSASGIDDQIEGTYMRFDQKGATLQAQHENMDDFNLWNEKALDLRKSSKEVISFLLSECNEMIKLAEGEDWIEEQDDDGNITKLRSLDKIENMDDYDIPTNLFVGGNPEKPGERGMALVEKIHGYRNHISEIMATYTTGQKSWSFKAPEKPGQLSQALLSANPADTAIISRFYKSLTLPEVLHVHGEEGELPWVSVTFDHAPIVAAAAMFTSLKLDIKSAQALSAEYMLAKIDVTPFNFNKIDPMAIANTAYINQGDSLQLNVMIAAYDSTSITRVRYGIDADTANKAAWKETNGGLALDGAKPGLHRVKGEIAVRERGEIVWKPWDFSYTVGQPMGVIAQPDMRVLYWGYDNVIESAASGYPADKIKLSPSGCSLRSNGNGKYYVDVTRGTRTASISISGLRDDGSSVNLGKFDFQCKSLPRPTLYFGSAESGGSCRLVEARATNKVRLALDPSVPLTNVKYKVTGGILRVSDLPGSAEITADGVLNQRCKNLIAQSAGKTLYFDVNYEDPSGIKGIESGSIKIQP